MQELYAVTVCQASTGQPFLLHIDQYPKGKHQPRYTASFHLTQNIYPEPDGFDYPTDNPCVDQEIKWFWYQVGRNLGAYYTTTKHLDAEGLVTYLSAYPKLQQIWLQYLI